MTHIDISTLIAVSLTSLVPVIAVYLWIGFALQTVFAKAGEEGWKGWVPFLNTAILLELGGFAWWWVLLLIIPGGGFVVYVVLIIACHRIGTRFGYGAGMTVLAALLFPVWASIMAWGRNRWVSAREAAPRGSGVQRAEPQPAEAWRTPMPAAVRPAPPVPPLPAAAPAWAPAAAVAPAPAAAPAAAVSEYAAPQYAAPDYAAAGYAAPDSAAPGYATPDYAAHGYAAPGSSSPEYAAPAASTPTVSVPADASRPAAAAAVPDDDTFAAFAPPSADARDADDDDLDEPAGVVPPASVAGPFTGTVQIIPAATDDAHVGPLRAAPPADDDEPADDHVEAPIREVPEWRAPDPEANPWAPPAASAPAQVRPFDPTAFSDTSGEVSAVAGAPSLGVPMSARSSVSALRQAPELPDSEDVFDETIIASRKRTPWMLVPPLGAPIPIVQDVVIVGRRPVSDPAFPQAQLVAIVDETRTVSKTHARLELKDDTLWAVTDLDSTNGVVIIDEDGTEIDVEPHRPLPVLGRFLLGDAELAMERDEQ